MKYLLAIFLLACIGPALAQQDTTMVAPQQRVPPDLSTATAPNVVFMGDSVPALWMGPATTPDAEALDGFPTWTKILSNYRINAQVSTNKFAIGGYTTANILNLIPAALARKPDLCVVLAGGNDAFANFAVGNESQVGSTIYNLNRLYDELQDGGCVIIAIKPISLTFANWPAGSALKALRTGQWIEQQKLIRKGFYVLDLGNVYDDPANTTHWNPKAHYTTPSNNIHPAQWGAYAIGKALAAQINLLYPNWRLRIQNVEDVYDATNNPTGNLLPQQMFTGTAGAISGGVPLPTGTVATGWTLLGTNSGGMTVVASKTTTTDGRPAQTITISGTSNTGFIDLRIPMTQTNINQGDVIECSVDANWGTTTNIALVAPLLVSVEGATSYTPTLISGGLTADVGEALPTETGGGGGPETALSVALYTPQHTVTVPPSSFAFSVRISASLGLAASPVAGTFQLASPSCRKILPVTVP